MRLNFGIFLKVSALAFMVLMTGCKHRDDPMQSRCMDFLYKYMSSEDDLLHNRYFWEENVRKTLEVKSKMSWNVPYREFMHFVLPLRAFNEQIDDFRTEYADTLCRRVAGMSMVEAALEVNHWCREQAAYDASVPPASSPMGTVELGCGACIELSGLLVCALRSVGIPARQVIVTWTYAEGNHSWVEAWVDGGWHYMGGCEPSLKLDWSWCWDRATQIMLAPIRVFGHYDGPETILSRDDEITMISNLNRYAPEKNLKILVNDQAGHPVPGATVMFLVGPGEHKTAIHGTMTDQEGSAFFRTGFGDCAVLAYCGDSWGLVKAESHDKVVLVSLLLREDEALSALGCMSLAPPVASIVPGSPDDWESWKDEEARRIERDDSVRVARHCK